jgi:Spy/CpxP family protein refolding chaperone
MRIRSATALAVATVLAAGMARAQEQSRDQDQEGPRLSPALEQLRETVSDRLHTAADTLGLSAEQRDKIRDIHARFAEKYQAQRDARQELRQQEFKSLGAILTPEQRDKVKSFVEEHRTSGREGASNWQGPEVAGLRDSIAERIQSAARELGLSDEQRQKIRESVRPFIEKYRDQRAENRNLVEEELKADAEVLTLEQRAKARRYIEGWVVTASAAQSVADRLRAAAEKLSLTAEQRAKITETRESFAEKARDLRQQRRELLQDELQAVAKVLTPEQREKARDFSEDRVVVVGIEFDPAHPPTVAQLRETIAGRLNAAADRLGLTSDQRDKIRDIHARFAEKYQAQRDARQELRQQEFKSLGAILTPEQREQIRDFVEDRDETDRDR